MFSEILLSFLFFFTLVLFVSVGLVLLVCRCLVSVLSPWLVFVHHLELLLLSFLPQFLRSRKKLLLLFSF